MKTRAPWILLTLIVLAPTSCVRYEETPPGPAVPEAAEVERRAAPATESADRAPSFTEAYETMGKPRMIVYATLPYTGQINEWRTEERAVIGLDATARMEEDEGDEGVEVTGEASGTTFTSERRERPTFTDDELLLERAFVRKLVESGVRVIDRDVILRQEAMAYQDVDAMEPVVLSESVVESYALTNNVDWVITLDLLGESTLPCADRRYTATAKGVESGEILASVDSEDARVAGGGGRVVATREGYQRRAPVTGAGCAEYGEALAEELMKALARRGS